MLQTFDRNFFNSHTIHMAKASLNLKTIVLSFTIPFAIATAGYHSVYVSDAGRGAQGYSMQYPNVPVAKAIQLEENKRWQELDKWLIHMLIFGLPAGLLSVSLVLAAQAIRNHSRNSG